MSFKKLPPGIPPFGVDQWDYSHLLPESARKEGLRLLVDPDVREGTGTLDASIRREGIWGDVGNLYGIVRNGRLEIGLSNVDPELRGKGIGTALYEGIMQHAAQELGVSKVAGDRHSTSASKVHSKISDKYGLDYKPVQTKKPKSEVPSDYDERFDQYEYTLKEEKPPSKKPISSIPVGKSIDENTFDYSFLTNEPGKILLQKNNDKLVVVFVDSDNEAQGGVEGKVSNNVLYVGDAFLSKNFRNKGIGKSLYKALFSFAKNELEASKVIGAYHTSDAARVHESIARDHGGEFNKKDNSYEYLLKSENYEDLLKEDIPDELLQAAQRTAGGLMGSKYMKAAHFLSNKAPDLETYRKALRRFDDDILCASLAAHSIPPSSENIKALQGVSSMMHFEKREDIIGGLQDRTAVPFSPVDEEVAEKVARALDTSAHGYLDSDGKHTQNAEVVYDNESREAYIIKYPSHKTALAQGIAEEKATQPFREAAFYRIAELLDISQFFPVARMIYMGGHEAVAIKVITNARSFEEIRREDPNRILDLLEPYRQTGHLHMWAAIDYLLGNPDRHSNNIIAQDKNVFLIDHGTSFAGYSFDPAHDENSFIPFYLRAWGMRDFHAVDPIERLRRMPRIGDQEEQMISSWVSKIDEDGIRQTLRMYGINPEPTLERLAWLKAAPVKHEFLNEFFAGVFDNGENGLFKSELRFEEQAVPVYASDDEVE